MYGSIFIGLSGMNAYSNALRQISNNITNLNSTGYKASNSSFADMVGRDALSFRGQGQGVSLGDPQLDFKQGELRQTSNDLDLAVDGQGFLVLLKDGDRRFVRTGSFNVDKDGFVVLAGTQQRLAVLDAAGQPTPVSIDGKRASPPKATTRIKFSDNLSSTATEHNLSNLTVYDSTGKSDTWQARFERAATAPAGEWTLIVRNSSGAEIDRKQVKFNNGQIDPSTAQVTISSTGSGPAVIFDFSTGVTSFSSGSVSTLQAGQIDGYGVGELTSVRVNDKGVLEASYSNQQTQSLGEVALALFQDPQGLAQRDGGQFEAPIGASARFLASQDERVGQVQSRRQEASNVDLSQQFGDLILVQRGYQASSQIVSVSNEMIQQLFGIRGQG
jgi:flagellar hook protein FlgE